MSGLVPGPSTSWVAKLKSMDGRDKPGHDGSEYRKFPEMGSRMRPRLRYMTLFANTEEGRQ